MELYTYSVTSQLHHGRLFRTGDPITLNNAEAAELGDHIDLNSQREADPAALPPVTVSSKNSTDENGKLLDRIVELQTDLDAVNKAMATIIDDNNAIVAERDKTIADLTAKLDNLESAKQATKGKA